jgi:putative ABC transport system permease protein
MKKTLCFLMLTGLLMADVSCREKDPSFHIDLVKYIDNSYTQTFEDSLREGLEAAGLVAGRDYRLKSRSAQGDMSTLTMLIDSAESDRTDLLITFQAPTLYTAIQRAPSVNKAFTLLQNPFILGAGKSDADHMPRLTGLYLVPPFEELFAWIEQCKPAIRTVGVIYDSGNEDSAYRRDELAKFLQARNMELISVPYTALHEITTAAEALVAMKPQAVMHLQDPAQDVTFPALFKNASRRKIPVFSVVYNTERIGAVITCSTDRKEIGDQFAQMVVRIVKGSDPSTMPFENDRALRKRTGYNRTVAADIKLTLPDSLIHPTQN